MTILYPDCTSVKGFDEISKLTTAVATTAVIERIFSKFGLTQTKLRKKLGIEKAAKLVFINQQLNL